MTLSILSDSLLKCEAWRGDPVCDIVAFGDVYSAVIQWMNDSPKPTLRRIVQFASNVFLASNDTVMASFCSDILQIKLKSLLMLSEAFLFLMKRVCSGCCSRGLTVSIMVASVLVIIFKLVLIREMDHYSNSNIHVYRCGGGSFNFCSYSLK